MSSHDVQPVKSQSLREILCKIREANDGNQLISVGLAMEVGRLGFVPIGAEPPTRSILKDWVTRLGLRYQGVLLTAVRGCDNAPKEDASKDFSRMYRGMILNTHCADPLKALSFIQVYDNPQKEVEIFTAFRKDLDHYPHHFVMHLVHAIEIIGYKHSDLETRYRWNSFYYRLCKGLHTSPESEAELALRLEADEEAFGREQKA
jgi:hypothetical protein